MCFNTEICIKFSCSPCLSWPSDQALLEVEFPVSAPNVKEIVQIIRENLTGNYTGVAYLKVCEVRAKHNG